MISHTRSVPKIPGLAAILICCAGLAACTATATKGPDVSVTPPSVGTPPPPASVDAALAREAFTPYAGLGDLAADGLAPGESFSALGAACIAAEGFPADSGSVPIGFRISGGLAFAQPYGQWGYLGIVTAEQYGFFPGPGVVGQELGIHGAGQGGGNQSAAEQAALGKCANIVISFTSTEQEGPLAGIQTLANDIFTDVRQHPAVKRATRAWSACMARNGYSVTDPMTAFRKAIMAASNGSGQVTAGQVQDFRRNQAQIALAVTDADCTQSTDLAGIYFAVEASYEQQIVEENREQLNSAVQQYRTAYGKELAKLPALLKTTPTAAPFTIRPSSPGK